MAEGDQASSLAAEVSGTATTIAPGNPTQTTPDLIVKFAELKEEERGKLARFKTGNDIVKSYLSLESKLGASITLPGKDATDEEKTAFYKRLGRPETKDGYALDTLFLADGVTKDSDTENRLRDMAFDLGLNQENAKRLHKTFIDLANRGAAMVSEMKEKARDGLHKEWGGEYDRNIAMVGTILRKFGDAQTIQYMNSGPGNDPVMLRLLAKFGKTISPDTLETGGAVKPENGESDGSDMFPNSPQMTGANRNRRIQ
jgi:hypothetical protein